jgi:hypothetical protein
MRQELQESLLCPQYQDSILRTLYVNVTGEGGFSLSLVSSGFDLETAILCQSRLLDCDIYGAHNIIAVSQLGANRQLPERHSRHG